MPEFLVSFDTDTGTFAAAAQAAIDAARDTAARQLAREKRAPLADLFSDFYGHTSAPAEALTGHALGYVGSGAPARVEHSRLYAGDGAGTKALYIRSGDLGDPVQHLGIRFVFEAGSGGTGGLACIGVTTEQVTGGLTPATIDMPLHIWTTKAQWSITAWDGSNNGGTGQDILASGYYAIPLLADDTTEYEIEAWINGTTITVRLPDGTVETASDAKVAAYAGNFCFFESMRGGASDDTAGITHVWADTHTVPPEVMGGVVRQAGTQVIAGYKAFLDTVNVAGSLQMSTGAGVGKVMTSDEWGIAHWTDLEVATGAARRNSIMAIGDSLSAACSEFDATNNIDSHAGATSGGHSASDWLWQGNLLAGSPMEVLGASATPGYTADQILTGHLPVAVAAAPDFCTVWAGGNDALAGGDTVTSTVLGKIRTMCQQLEAVGTTPILVTMPPADGIGATEIDRYNAWVSNYAQLKGYPLIDAYSVLVDPATGAYKSGYSDDGIHPNGTGTAALAPVVRDVISKIARTGTRAQLACWGGLGGVAANPLLALGSGSTPSGWTTMGSPTLALGAAGAYPGQAWTITRGGSDGLCFGPQIDCGNGDVWDFCMRIEAAPGASGAWRVGLLDQTGSAFHAIAYGQRLTVPANTILHWRGVVSGGRTKIQPFLMVEGASGSQLKVGQITLRNLTDLGADLV